MSNDYLGSLDAIKTTYVQYDQTKFEAELAVADDGVFGDADDKIDVRELKEVFQSMGLTSAEARGLAKFCFNPKNNFLKSNGDLDIDKVFQFLETDDTDAEVSTAELKMAMVMVSEDVALTTNGTFHNINIDYGHDRKKHFAITENNREMAVKMVNIDGVLNLNALQTYLNDSSLDISNKRAVLFLSMLAVGYDKDDILDSLDEIMEQIKLSRPK